jgi:hypothetical protein
MNAEPIEITPTQKNTSASVVTTLYDLIAAIQDVVDADDNTLVLATLRSILGAGGLTWRAGIASCAG